MNYVHWMDLLIFLGGVGAFLLVLALTELIGGRK